MTPDLDPSILSLQLLGIGLMTLLFLSLAPTLRDAFAFFDSGLASAPRVRQHRWLFGTDFTKAYQEALGTGRAISFMQDLLLTTPGRTASVRVWGQTWLYTSNPANIQTLGSSLVDSMLVAPVRNPRRTNWIRLGRDSDGDVFIGDGMFMSDGEKWKTSRSLFKPMFGRIAVSKGLPGFAVHIRSFLKSLPPDGTTVDLQPLLKRLYLQASMMTLFGRSMESNATSQHGFDIEDFERSFEQAMAGFYNRAVFGNLFRSWKRDDSWLGACATIHKVFDRLIEESIIETQKRDISPPDGNDLSASSMVAFLLTVSKDPMFIRDQLLNVFIGAKDTAGIGISDILFHLARHPSVYEKLREEALRNVRGQHTFETLKAMPYLQSVIAESIRLLSPVNISVRTASQDTTLPQGGGESGKEPIFVTKGTRIEANVTVLHTDQRYWGEDASEFRPERWKGLIKRWEYIPFLGGPRMCPAQQMILTQYALILTLFAESISKLESRDSRPFYGKIVFSQENAHGVKVAIYREP